MDLQKDKETLQKKISYRHKEPTVCPVCSFEFFIEEMMTGGGRLIAGKLSDELRRLYEKNVKFGKVYPLAYIVTVCPRCFYAAYHKDFGTITPDEIAKISQTEQARKESVKKFFGEINFDNDRTLPIGAASYLLAVDCYNYRGKKTAPTIKKAVSCIRAAWLFDDLSAEMPDKPYKKISNFFYQKAYEYYPQTLDLLQKGGELLEDAGNLGPDYDKNWGYEGILYMCAILTVKFGVHEKDINKRIKKFDETKRYLSRLFGSGKSSKTKPGPLVDMIRDLYDKINELLEAWNKEIGQPEA